MNPIGPSRTIDEPGPCDDTDVVAFSNAKVTSKNWITKYIVTINRDDVLRPVTITVPPESGRRPTTVTCLLDNFKFKECPHLALSQPTSRRVDLKPEIRCSQTHHGQNRQLQ